MAAFVGSGMWHLIRQSDGMSYAVLALLLLMSVICWSIFLYKIIISTMRRKQLAKGIAAVSELRTIEQLYAFASPESVSVSSPSVAAQYGFASTVVADILAHSAISYKKTGMSSISGEQVNEAINQAIDAGLSDEESGLAFLSTSSAVGPLLGLFGTVWGIVNSFMRISEEQSADITAVAPGLSQALVATLAGLMVAIPALIMYNVLLARLGETERLLVQLGGRVSFLLQVLDGRGGL